MNGAKLTLAAVAAIAAAVRRPHVLRRPMLGSRSAFAGQNLYHGSTEAGIREFDQQNTAYGYYFTPDPETANYYGDNLYTVQLDIENLADFDDASVLKSISEYALGVEPVRMKRGKWGDLEEAEMEDMRLGLSRLVQRSSDANVQRWLAAYVRTVAADSGLNAAETAALLTDPSALADSFDWDDIEPDYGEGKELLQLSLHLQASFDEDFPEIDKNFQEVQAAYGEQNFYMYYQDDLMRGAESMGYDGVIFSDPSPTGQSVSVVVFSPRQIRVVKQQRRERL